MTDLENVQLSQSDSDMAQLKEQFELIDRIVNNGGTVTLNLSDDDRAISLTFNHEKVVRGDAADLRPRRTTRSQGDNKSLTSLATNTFSLDIGDINRRVRVEDIDEEFKKHSVKERPVRGPSDASARVMRSSSLPNPAIRYIGDNWQLAEDCVYRANDGFTITARSGFITDLSSIPRIFWPLIASHELSVTAPVFHDLIYRSGGEVKHPDGEVAPADKTFTREEADNIFLELMTRAKIAYWKRNVAFLAVRAFAETSWRALQ
jgi:hypothetical protein